jgi:hypothetical protein
MTEAVALARRYWSGEGITDLAKPDLDTAGDLAIGFELSVEISHTLDQAAVMSIVGARLLPSKWCRT